MCAFGGKIHRYFGIMLCLLFAVNGTFINPIFVVIGSLLPDCDIKEAPISILIPLWRLKGVTHRGITHTIYALLFVTVITFVLFGKSAGIGMFVGYFSHLFLDSCTPMGVKWFNLRGVVWRKQNYKKRKRHANTL